MLQHGGLVVTEPVGCCRGMLFETSRGSSLRFSDISPLACCGVGSGTRYVVDMAYCLFLFELVFGFDKSFPDRAS